MIRLCRVSRSSLGAVSEKICLQLPKWRQELALNFPQELLLSLPEIAADNNSPRKFQIVVGTEAVIDAVVAKLEAIKVLAKGSGDNAIALNTATD